jgi:hypothetical protein
MRQSIMQFGEDPKQPHHDIENVELVFRDDLGFNSAKLLESVRGGFGLY